MAPAELPSALDPPGGATVTLPNDREIVIVRGFAAPRAAVFAAWTEAARIAVWWDPRRQPLAVCEVDLRPGGQFRFVPRGPEGAARPFVGRYREITPPARLVFATPAPTPGAETIGTLVFAERHGRTTLTITMSCASAADRDALLEARVDAGTTATLDNLHRHLAARRPPSPSPV